MTETREHGAEERAGERDAFNGTAERRSLFTVAHLCSQRETERDRKKKRGRIDGEIVRHSEEGRVVLKLGPLHSSTAESLERDNGLEGVIKREREGEKEKKRAGK